MTQKSKLGNLLLIGGIALTGYLFLVGRGSGEEQPAGGGTGGMPLTGWLSPQAAGVQQDGEAGTPLSIAITQPAVSFPAMVEPLATVAAVSEPTPTTKKASGGYVVERGGYQYYQPYGGGTLQGYTPAITTSFTESKKEASVAASVASAAISTAAKTSPTLGAISLGAQVAATPTGQAVVSGVLSAAKTALTYSNPLTAGVALAKKAAHYGATENKTPSWSGE